MNDGDVPGVSLREFARQRGVSLAAVQKAIATGRIHKLPDGKIDPKAAGAEWDANTSKAQQRGAQSEFTEEGQATQAARAAAAGVTLPPEPRAPSGAGGRRSSESPAPTPGTITAHRTKREEFAALTAELEYQQAAGRLVDADEVAAGWTKIITAAKSRILGIPSKIKTQLQRLTVQEMAIIDGIVRNVLEELAGE